MSKKIKFNLDRNPSVDEDVIVNEKKKSSKLAFFQSKSLNDSASQSNLKNDVKERKQKTKLVQYLQTEKEIVKKKVQIDSEEKILLDSLSDQVIDLDKYLKFPEPKAKDKLWRIPYSFTNSEAKIYTEVGPKSINRFSAGVDDGCFVSLSLPAKPDKLNKNWEQIIEEADEVLEQFEQAKWSRLSHTRRGSTLQPRHVFLTPNPELGINEKLLLSGHSMVLRDWTSELFLPSQGSDAFLDDDYKQSICLNTSINDLSNMPFPDLRVNISNYSNLTSSEIQYIQTVRSRRRQSLVPPTFGDRQNDLQFRRQSFAGGGLWSAKVENARKQEIYHQRLAMINPNFIQKNQNSEHEFPKSLIASELLFETEETTYPEFDYRSVEEARLFAHELTLIVRQHFIAIKESEIVNFITHSGPQVLNSCPNIKSLFHFQNRIIRLIATCILRHDDLDKRAETVLFFIQALNQLHQLNNWHSINVITQSLQCPPIVRLKQTWRQITFNYAELYCDFIQLSEDLAMGKQLASYKTLNTFIPIFDDVVDEIKEKCGFKIVQIHQHRLHKNWDASKDNDLMTWVNSEILDLLQDINGNLEGIYGLKSTNNNKDKQSTNKKVSFFNRIFRSSNNSKKQTKKDKVKNDDSINHHLDSNNDESDFGENIYQRRFLPGQIINRSVNVNSKMPSCKKFWSISEYIKLRDKDREQVKQEVVRTLVAFQKKTFCVFEERDEEIKHFLLHSHCDSMDACMLRSRLIEGDTKKEHIVSHHTGEDGQLNGIISHHRTEFVDKSTTISPENTNNLPNVQTEPQTVRPLRTRRVMFAQDLNCD